MTTQLDANVKDDLKTQFVTREGTYRLLTLSEYSRPNRVGYTCNQSSPQVRVSIVTLPSSTAAVNLDNSTATNTLQQQQQQQSGVNGNNNATATTSASNGSNIGAGDAISSHQQQQQQQSYAANTGALDVQRSGIALGLESVLNAGNGGGNGNVAGGDNSVYCSSIYGGDRICFNFGRELHVYAFRGVKKGTEISKPIDKKCYKVTNPSCHDFNVTSATPTGAPLLVGFTTGPIQLVSPQPGPREMRKLFNEERLIDKTKVTCLKWLPNSPNLFLASHASGHLYLYNEDLPCMATAPTYQPFKMGDGYTILTCKSKSTRNPLYKWVFTTENCCINEFAFSPCGSNLAIVSQDGFLRVFHYDTMELLGIARSYFGGFLCVCWSPDGKYIVVGGEDDLVTVWSLHERRVVARGQGHRSWVSVVAFDPYTTSYTSWDGGDFSDDEQYNDYAAASSSNGYEPTRPNRMHSASFRSDTSSSAALPPDKLAITYRLGSVGQDTQICLWDITEDVLRHPYSLRQRVNSLNLNDTSYMNGNLDSDGVKIIRPVAIGNNSSGSFTTTTAGQQACSPQKDNTVASSIEINSNSNSSSSKFSTANCTISSHSSNANTPPDDVPIHNKSNKNNSNSSIKFPNCISATKPDPLEGNNLKNSSSTFSTSGYNSKASNSSSKSSNSSGGISAFNSLTQRLSLSFLNNTDKKNSTTCSSTTTSMDIGQNSSLAQRNNNRKAMSLLKSYNQNNFSNSNHNTHSNNKFGNSSTLDISGSTPASSSTAYSFGSLKICGKSSTNATFTPPGAVVNSYDPMKLIGTPACPRFDECPLLEPLVCKKIAHERLTALIFREDCFLTACQDGFIYTWARPGYSTNAAQHLSPNQTAPPGGTVI